MSKTNRQAVPHPVRGLTQSTLQGLFWMSLGTGVQSFLQVTVLVILARLLTPVDFGVVAAAMVVIGFSSIFSQLGVGPAIVQRQVLETTHLRTAFTMSVSLGMLLMGVIWSSAYAISAFFRVDQLAPAVKALSLVFLLQSVSVVAESLLQRHLLFRYLASLDVIAVAVGFAGIGVSLALLGCGVWALVGAHLGQAFVKTVLLLRAQPHPKRLLIDRQAFAELMFFGGGFTVARVANYLAGQGDNLVVGRALGAYALGLYGRAYQLMAVPAMLLGQVLDRVLFPALARVQHDRNRLAKTYRRAIALVATVILPTSIIAFLLANQLVEVLLGPQWNDAVVPFQILAAGMLFRTSYKLSDCITRATGAVYRRAWRQTIYAILVLAGASGGQHWGLPGVAFGVLCAIAINFLLMAQLSLSITGLTWREFWAAHRPALTLAVTLGAEVHFLATTISHSTSYPIIVLITVIVCSSLLLWFLFRFLPDIFLGEEGIWMVRTLATYLRPLRPASLIRQPTKQETLR
jgi:O-antigen/teichoic acid export membrane protein